MPCACRRGGRGPFHLRSVAAGAAFSATGRPPAALVTAALCLRTAPGQPRGARNGGRQAAPTASSSIRSAMPYAASRRSLYRTNWRMAAGDGAESGNERACLMKRGCRRRQDCRHLDTLSETCTLAAEQSCARTFAEQHVTCEIRLCRPGWRPGRHDDPDRRNHRRPRPRAATSPGRRRKGMHGPSASSVPPA